MKEKNLIKNTKIKNMPKNAREFSALESGWFSLLLGCVIVGGFAYIYHPFYPFGLNCKFTTINNNVGVIMLRSFNALIHLQGGYWIWIKSIFCLLGMIGVMIEIGDIVVKRLAGMKFEHDCISVPIHYAVGSAVMATVWLVLGSLGWLFPAIAYSFIFLGIFSLVASMRRYSLQNTFHTFKEFPFIEKIMLLALLIWILGWATPAILAEGFWDSLMQHLGLPWQYILNQRIVANEYHIFSYFSQNAEMLFMWALLLKNETLARLLNWTFWVGMIILIYGTLRTMSSKRVWALIGSSIFAVLLATFWEISIAKTDLAFAFYLLCGYSLWIYMEDGRKDVLSSYHYMLCGFMFGAASGTKYIGFLAATHILMVQGVSSLFQKTSDEHAPKVWNTISLPLLLIFAGIVIAFSPWGIRNFALTRNPIYPYFNTWFAHAPIRFWHATFSIATDPGLTAGLAGYASFFKKLTGSVNCDQAYGIGPLLSFFILVPLGVLLNRRAVRWGSILTLTGWFVFSLSALIVRYQIAFIALVSIMIGVILEFFSRQNKGAVRLCVSLIFLSVSWGHVYIPIRNTLFAGIANVLMGNSSETMSMEGYEGDWPELVSVYQWTDANIPKNVKLVLVGENRIYKAPRAFFASSSHDEQMVYILAKTSQESISSNLKKMGITHGIINLSAWNEYVHSRKDLDAQVIAKISEFYNSGLRILTKSPSGNYVIFALQ